MKKKLIVFDMDGVLVDVTESYRETIARTVQHFSGVAVTRQQIQECKNQGGWNDDWKLSQHLCVSNGADVSLSDVKDYFQSIFIGDGNNGLILHEKWVARAGVLENLSTIGFDFAVFTGRPKAEAALTLQRFAAGVRFEPVIAMEDVENHKPHPEGLLKLTDAAFYVGDTVDDARCARAARVPFIGIAAPSNPLYLDLVFLFQEEGAYAIIDDINYLEEVFTA
jgi:HAD superfamily phosphatase